MEIDVREESKKRDTPDVIKFSEQGFLERCDEHGCYISRYKGDGRIYFLSRELVDLIKALKKYQELYGND